MKSSFFLTRVRSNDFLFVLFQVHVGALLQTETGRTSNEVHLRIKISDFDVQKTGVLNDSVSSFIFCLFYIICVCNCF